jgi:hypothetical protein
LPYGNFAGWRHCSPKKQHKVKMICLTHNKVPPEQKRLQVMCWLWACAFLILNFKIEKQKGTRKKETVLVLTRTSPVQKTN